MQQYSVFALDIKTNKIVHIEEVPESYPFCICPKCSETLVAANKNIASRKNAIYFRHQLGNNCNQETALHQYAKQILCEKMIVWLPHFQKALERIYENGEKSTRESKYKSC